MEQTVIEYFTKQLGVGTVVLLIIIGGIDYLMWWLSAKDTKRMLRVDNLRCKSHEESIDKLVTSINNVNITLGKL